MKVLLLVLSGNSRLARERLAESYSATSIETISRDEIGSGSFTSRLKALRSRRANVFAIATERIAWQQGQNLLMLFGALAGAQEVVILDAHGGFRKESRVKLLLYAPARLAREAFLSAAIIERARRELLQLEREITKAPPPTGHSVRKAVDQDNGGPKICYMRGMPGPGTHAGGASTHVVGVVKALQALGASVRFITNDLIPGLDPSQVPSVVIGPEPLGTTRAVFDIHNNAVFTCGAVPVVEHNPPGFIYQRYARFGWAGVVASLRSHRPLFLEYNGSEVWVARHWDHVGMLKLLARYEHLNLAAAARIFVVSEVSRLALERAGFAPEKIIVNPNGVDTEMFHPDAGGARVRAELGLRDGEPLVGFVGTFGPWHGVRTLAEAIKLIPKSSGIRFLLVGTGTLHNEMNRLLEEQNKTRQVIFTGPVEHERVPALLDACDVLVSPHVPFEDGSEFFGSPTKLFEYMAMGKGIVASRLGQIGDVLVDEESALLVKPGDAYQLSEGIQRLINFPDLRQRLGTAARNAVLKNHTWAHNARRILHEYGLWLEQNSEKTFDESRNS